MGRPATPEVVIMLPPFQKLSAFRLFLSWYVRNRQLATFLRRRGVPHLTVGYEEFAIQTDFMVDEICTFLGLTHTDTSRAARSDHESCDYRQPDDLGRATP